MGEVELYNLETIAKGRNFAPAEFQARREFAADEMCGERFYTTDDWEFIDNETTTDARKRATRKNNEAVRSFAYRG